MLFLQRRTGLQLFLSGVLVGLFSTGVTPSPADDKSPPPTTGWKIMWAESGSNPVMADSVLYLGSADGAVYSLNPNTGETKWRFQTGENLSPATSGPQVITVPRGTSTADQMVAGMDAVERQIKQGIRRVDMTPAVENGTIFIGSGDRSFYAIDAATGKKKWSYVAGSGMSSNNYTSYPVPAAVLKNSTVYFVTEDGLHALDAVNGKRKWLFEPPQGKTPSKPAGLVVGDDSVFLTARTWATGSASWKQSLYAVDPESGKEKWVTSVADFLDIRAPIRAANLVFFSVEESFLDSNDRARHGRKAMAYAVDAANGRTKWTVGTELKYSTLRLLIASNAVFFSTDKNLLALDLETGRQLWSFSADEIQGDLSADEQQVYVITHKGSFARPKDTLHALALTTGQEKWSQELSGLVYSSLVHDGVVYAGREHLHAMDAATGRQLWSFKGTGRESPRLISGGRIFLSSPTTTYFGTKRVDQGYLYAIDAKTGKLKP